MSGFTCDSWSRCVLSGLPVIPAATGAQQILIKPQKFVRSVKKEIMNNIWCLITPCQEMAIGKSVILPYILWTYVFLEIWKFCRLFFPLFFTNTDADNFCKASFLGFLGKAYFKGTFTIQGWILKNLVYGLLFQLAACEEGEITSGFHHLVQTIMTYICALMELRVEDQTLAKFYRALTHKIYDLLDKVRLYSNHIVIFTLLLSLYSFWISFSFCK